MTSLPLVTKPFNYYGITITASYDVLANTYNLIYGQPVTPIILTLPVLAATLDGFPIIIRNFGPADITVYESDGTPVTDMLAGTTLLVVADKQDSPETWRAALGPIGGAASPISGPGLSTNNAVVRWNGTTGSALQNSLVIIDNLGNISGANSIEVSSASSIGGNLTLNGGGQLVYASGINTTTFANAPSGTNTWTFRNVSDSVVGESTTDVFVNKTITSTTNTVAASFLNSETTQIQINTATAPTVGQVLTATSPNGANWQTLPTSVSGPITSVNNAIATWNGTGGTILRNTSVILDTSGNISGVVNFSSTGNASAANLSLTGNIVYTNGANSTTLSATPTGLRSLVLPDASDTLVGRQTTDTLTNKTITDVTNNVAANSLKTTGSAVNVSLAAPPSAGQGIVATSPTTATWQNVTAYTPTTPGNWLTVPTTIAGALDDLAASVGTFLVLGVDPAVTATGASQGTAYSIIAFFTNVTTAAASTGVILPQPATTAGNNFIVKNNGLSPVNVYPPSSGSINALGTNTAFPLTAGLSQQFIATTTTHYETVT